MVPFWIPIIIRHLIFRVPQKRDHNFDNHPYIPSTKPCPLITMREILRLTWTVVNTAGLSWVRIFCHYLVYPNSKKHGVSFWRFQEAILVGLGFRVSKGSPVTSNPRMFSGAPA